jgi:hypothetical protein
MYNNLTVNVNPREHLYTRIQFRHESKHGENSNYYLRKHVEEMGVIKSPCLD